MARWRMIAGTVEDDRGKRFRPEMGHAGGKVSLRLLSANEVRKRRDADPAGKAATIRLNLLRRAAERRILPGLAAIFFAVVLGFAIFVTSTQTGLVSRISTGVFIACLALLFVVVPWQYERWQERRERRLLADLPRSCIACRYDLTGLPRADDGLAVCPECGAAWDFETIDGL